MSRCAKILVIIGMFSTLYASLKPYWIFPQDIKTSSSVLKWVEERGGRARTISKLLGSFSAFVPEKDMMRINSVSKKTREIARFTKFTKNLTPFDVSEFTYESYLEILKIPEVHKRGVLGDNVRIGILDAGFDFNHPALKHLINPEYKRIVATHDFNSGDHLFIKFPTTNFREISYNQTGAGYVNSFDLKNMGNETIVFYSYSHDSILYAVQGISPRNFWKIFVCKVNELGEFTLSPKLIKRDSFAIKPSFEITGNNIFLVYKTKRVLFELNFSLLENPDSFNIVKDTVIYYSAKIIKPSILNIFNRLGVFFLDTNGLKVLFSQDSGNTWNESLIVQGNFSDYEIKKSSNGFSGFLIKGNPWESESLLIFRVDSIYNLISLKSISESPSADLVIKNDTIKICYFDYQNLWFSIFDSSLTQIQTQLIDTGIFIYSPAFYYEGNELKIIYSKYGSLFASSVNSPAPDTVDYFYTDLIGVDSATILLRRRGDTTVTFEEQEDYDFNSFTHGARVLSVIAGVSPGELTGVSPGSKFILARTERTTNLSGEDFENIIEEDFWVEGLEWAISKGAKIINSSLGYILWWNKNDLDGKTAPSSVAASKAIKKDVLLVNAIGNLGDNEFHQQIGVPDTTLHAPSDADSIISVGGITIDSVIEVHPKSCYGPSADGRKKPDVVAPWSAKTAMTYIDQNGDTIIGYAHSEGTSYSSAIVTGICALAWSAHPSWSARELMQYLKETSNLLGDSVDNISGWGYPDAEKLLFIETPEIPVIEPEPLEDRIILLYPNPTKYGYVKIVYVVTEGETPVDLKIYNVAGKIVFEKNFNFQPVGRYEYKWDLKDKNGKPVDPGTYIAVMKTSFNTSYYKFSVIK